MLHLDCILSRSMIFMNILNNQLPYASRFTYFGCIGAALLLSLAAVNLSGPRRKFLTVGSVLPSVLLLILIAYYMVLYSDRIRNAHALRQKQESVSL